MVGVEVKGYGSLENLAVALISGVLLILISLFPKAVILVSIMPLAVLKGARILMFATVAASGIQKL